MPCYRPLDAYIIAGKTKNGKQRISFKRENDWKERIKLPCGQCIGCRLLKSIMWATRCMHEASLHKANCFITLTYNEKYLPEDRSLRKDHFQKFLKRLRKKIAPTRVRYFMCGEYGEQTWRPHYHALLFGYDFPDKIQIQNKDVLNPYYISEELTGLWKYGNHIIANCTYETAAYCARYVTKKITGDKAEDHYHRHIIDFDEVTGEMNSYQEVDLVPEYATMSRKPGIGKGWFDKYKGDCYPSDYLIKDNKKLPIPKYYDKLMEDEDEYTMLMIKQGRKLRAALNEDNNDLDRLRAREKCKLDQSKTLKRGKV